MTARGGLALAFLLIGAPAAAHQADTGWVYDALCCSDQDCRHAEPGEVVEESGGFRIANTGELIPYWSTKIRPSRDAGYHVCQFRLYQGQEDELTTWCLYVPGMF